MELFSLRALDVVSYVIVVTKRGGRWEVAVADGQWEKAVGGWWWQWEVGSGQWEVTGGR